MKRICVIYYMVFLGEFAVWYKSRVTRFHNNDNKVLLVHDDFFKMVRFISGVL